MRDAAGELYDLDAAGDLALGIGKYFAVLFGDDAREIVVLAREDFEKFEQDPRPAQRRGRGPAGERGSRGLDGAIDVGGIRAGYPDRKSTRLNSSHRT